MVNEPSVFEPLRLYCTLARKRMHSVEQEMHGQYWFRKFVFTNYKDTCTRMRLVITVTSLR